MTRENEEVISTNGGPPPTLLSRPIAYNSCAQCTKHISSYQYWFDIYILIWFHFERKTQGFSQTYSDEKKRTVNTYLVVGINGNAIDDIKL